MSWVFVGLLALALAILVAAEWPRLTARFGIAARRERERARRKASFRVLQTDPDDDDFAASVKRDLAQLPTIDEHDRRN